MEDLLLVETEVIVWNNYWYRNVYGSLIMVF